MWRPMEPSDLAAVIKIADVVWGNKYYEAPKVFRQKLKFCPQGCWMYNSDAYVFSHPGVLDHPPGLNQPLPITISDCYHIHDIALLPRVRGFGIAHRMITQLLDRTGPITLVAVNGTQEFWESFGFTVRSQTAYGQYMTRLS